MYAFWYNGVISMAFSDIFSGIRKAFSNFPKTLRKLARPAVWPIIKLEQAFGRSLDQTKSDLETLGLVRPGTREEKTVDANVDLLVKQELLRHLSVDQVPNFDMLTEYDFQRMENYRWIVRILARESFTELYSERYISIYTDTLMTPKELMNRINVYLDVIASPYITSIISYEVYGIEHNPGAPY